MIKMIIGKMLNKIRKLLIKRKFKGAQLDHVVFGPELDKRFEVRHPENLTMGYKGENREVLSHCKRFDNL